VVGESSSAGSVRDSNANWFSHPPRYGSRRGVLDGPAVRSGPGPSTCLGEVAERAPCGPSERDEAEAGATERGRLISDAAFAYLELGKAVCVGLRCA